MAKNFRALKIILIVVAVIIVAGLSYFLFPQGNRKEEAIFQNYNKSNIVVKGDKHNYSDSGFSLIIPSFWKGKYKEEISKNKNKKTISFFYLDSKGGKDLILSFIIYKKPVSLEKIKEEPNQKIILENKNYLVAYSTSLEMPFQKGTEDYSNYGQMVKSIDDLIKTTYFKNGLYAKINNINQKGVINGNKKYSIIAHYPNIFKGEVNGQEEASFQNVNNDIRKTINNLIGNFKKEIKGNPPIKEFANASNKMIIDYSIGDINNDIFSLNLRIFNYLIGMAHPGSGIISKNYLLKKGGRLVSLSELFKNNNYLSSLSRIVEDKLEKEFSEKNIDKENNIFPDALSPKVENFDNFNLLENGIDFYFQAGRIAPRYLGDFKIFIPYQELKGIGWKESF